MPAIAPGPSPLLAGACGWLARLVGTGVGVAAGAARPLRAVALTDGTWRKSPR
jgi:hypothetical protein